MSPKRHASWGDDPSGYCGCDDCNVPDTTVPGLREAAQHLRDEADAWELSVQVGAAPFANAQMVRDAARCRAVAALLDLVDEHGRNPIYDAALAVAVAVTGQPKGAGDDD